MSNYGPPPFSAPYIPSASAPSGGYPYSSLPQYPVQQQSHDIHAPPQGHPSGAFPAHQLNTYAHSANARRANPNAFTNGNYSSTVANTGGGLSYDPHNPGIFPVDSNSSFGPSLFAALPQNHSSIIPPSPSPHNVIAQTLHTSHDSIERVKEDQATSEDDLEDGELSSGAMSEVNVPVNEDPKPDIDLQSTRSQQHRRLDSNSPLNDREMAHNLVRELRSWGFNFQDIMAEVTDNDALQSIFKEVGLSPESCSRERQTPQSQQLANNFYVPKDETSLDPAHDRKDDNVKPVENPRMEMGEPKVARSSISIPRSKNPTVSSDSKPLDRKALIAQKLAAKNAKPTPSQNVAQMPQEAVAEGVLPSNGEAPYQGLADSPATSTIAGQKTTNKANSNLPITTPKESEDERRIHTELARQRIEALKQKAAMKQSVSSSVSDTSNDATPATSKPASHSVADTPSKLRVVETDTDVGVPSRKESYFSPVSQTPMFSIPGLFPIAPPTSSDGLPNSVDQSRNNEDTFAVLPKPNQQTIAATSTQHPRPSTPSYLIEEGEESVVRISQSRHENSNLLDSAPSKLNRTLTQQDTGVIIDISDEESTRSDDENSITLGDGQSGDMLMQGDSPIYSGKQLNLRNLTPSGDLPLPKPSTSMSTNTATPTVMSTPKGQEPRELRTKEMEIELMNRKIAELEANIKARKAKQAASRGQSPGFSGQATSSRISTSPLTNGVDDSAASHVLPVSQDARLATSNLAQRSAPSAVQREPALIKNVANREDDAPFNSRECATRNDDADQLFESDLVEDDVVGAVEQSDSLEVFEAGEIEDLHDTGTPFRDISQGSKSHPQKQQEVGSQNEKFTAQQRSRRAEIESGLPVLDEEIEATRQKLQSLRDQEAELEFELKSGLEGRQMLLDELSRLSQAAAVIEYGQDTGSMQPDARIVQSSHSIDGLHPSDARDIEDNGSAPQSSTQATPASGIDGEADTQNVPEPADPSITHSIPDIDQSKAEDALLDMQVDRLSEGELEEDVMDISRSDIDEGEVTEDFDEPVSGHYDYDNRADVQHQPTPVKITSDATKADANVSDTQLSNFGAVDAADSTDENFGGQDDFMEEPIGLEEEEMYEPPNSISGIDDNSLPASSALGNNPDEAQQGALASTTPAALEDRGGGVFESELSGSTVPSRASKPVINDDQADKQTLSRMTGQSHQDDVVNGSDDDYEPPEPMSLNNDSLQALPPLAADSTALGTSSSDADSYDQQTLGATQVIEHFIPYESPLKQFKSYRHHPEYMKETSSGFRSLTYSHAIHPEIPICHYELGGTCNDSSCRAQHFSNMRISDDAILRELAKAEGSSPEKQEIFLAGLRALVSDLRKRNVGNLTDIASAITTYRKTFLADEFKVLPS